MKEFFKNMLSEADGKYSSKRVITFSAFILVSIAFVSNVFMDIPLKDFVFEGMLYLTAAGMGITTLEKFSKK